MSSFFFCDALGTTLLESWLLATIQVLLNVCKCIFQKGLRLIGEGEEIRTSSLKNHLTAITMLNFNEVVF